MAETNKSTTKARATETKNATGKERKERLDSELSDTFPASDPPSLTQPTTKVGGPDRKRRKASVWAAFAMSQSMIEAAGVMPGRSRFA